MAGYHAVHARVIDVARDEDGGFLVTAFVRDAPRRFLWPDAVPPSLGDIYRVTDAHAPRVLGKIGQASTWSGDGDAIRWRRALPSGVTRMEILRRRHVIRRAVRDYLDGEGFIEIDAPLLVNGATPDAGVDSFGVGERFLVATTEYQLKRMETGGFDRLYTLGKNFRPGDIGTRSNPEFSMLEWARVGEDFSAIEHDVEQIVWRTHRALGGDGTLAYNGCTINLTPPWPRLTVVDVVRNATGVMLEDFGLDGLTRAVRAAGLDIRPEWAGDRDFLFSLLLDHMQASLGFERPVFLTDWPSFMTSCALEKPGGAVCERSEAYIAGLELCNGFPALTDYDRQCQTLIAQKARRAAAGMPSPAFDESYLAALRAGLPAESSMALGFDRLVMLLTGQTEIRSVLAFAWDEV